jgi:hypothetical protein
VAAPVASVVEVVCGAWLAELFGLPLGISFGHVTGGQRDALMISAASVVVLGSGILPRWLALVGFLAAILALLHFLLPLIGAVSGLVWITLASALMLAGLSQGTPAPRRRARR